MKCPCGHDKEKHPDDGECRERGELIPYFCPCSKYVHAPYLDPPIFKAGDKVLLEAEIVSEEQKPFEYSGQAWIKINGAGGIFHVPLSTLRKA